MERENNLSAKFFSIGFVLLLVGGCLLSVACQTKEQKAAAALRQCQQLLDADKIQNIGDCYNEAMIADPEHAPEISKAGKTAFFKKCLEFKERKDFQQAITCFEGFTELEPRMANNYFLLANSYYEYYKAEAKRTGHADADFLDRAEEAVKSGLSIEREDSGAHSLYGQILTDKGDKKALAEHLTAVKLAPKTGIFWIELANAQIKFDQSAEAVNTYKQALNINPSDTDALYFLGLLYEKEGRIDDALESYKKILQTEHSDEEILQKVRDLEEQIKSKKQYDSPQKKTKTVGVNP